MRVILFVFFSVCISLPSIADVINELQSEGPAFVSARKTIDSVVLGEKRPYWVYLPESYYDKKVAPRNYPVLYLVDGEHYKHLSGVVHHMGVEGIAQTPEFILVGIVNTSDSIDRIKDLSPTSSQIDYQYQKTDKFLKGGGADAFLSFIKTELMPEIEKNYRTMPVSVLAGHSLGGLFVLHSFLADPDLFQCYIGIDPSLWWDNNLINQRLRAIPSGDRALKAKVYISLAEHPTTGKFDASSMIIENMRFVEYLNNNIGGVKAKLQRFPDENHASVGLISFYYGLKHCFDGYRPDQKIVLSGALSEHFEKFSNGFGIQFLPPEKYVNIWAGFAETYFEDSDLALELLTLNVKNYPASSYAWSRLGDFYKRMEKPKLARENYEKALEINPDNADARIGLEAL